MHFDKKASGNKSTRDRILIKLLKSPGLLCLASGISNAIFLSSNLDEICKRLKLLIQEKQAGNNSAIIIEERVVKLDNILEYKGLTPTQHKKIHKTFNLI